MYNFAIFQQLSDFRVWLKSPWKMTRGNAAVHGKDLIFSGNISEGLCKILVISEKIRKILNCRKCCSNFLNNFSGNMVRYGKFCNTHEKLEILSAFWIWAWNSIPSHRYRDTRSNVTPLLKWADFVRFSKIKTFLNLRSILDSATDFQNFRKWFDATICFSAK